MIETDTPLEKCPRCAAWQMAASLQRASSPQPEIRFRCPRCHADEPGRLGRGPMLRSMARDLEAV